MKNLSIVAQKMEINEHSKKKDANASQSLVNGKIEYTYAVLHNIPTPI